MKILRVLFLVLAFVGSSLSFAQGGGDEIRGLYKAILLRDGTNFYQYAKITLRTVNVGGQIKISANTKVLFGDWESNEYMTYDYEDVPLNILTRQINIKKDGNDVSMVGVLNNGVIEGEWFSTQVGKVGTFKAQKMGDPTPPQGGIMVRTLSGFYRGTLTNTNSQSNLPPRLTTSFVTTQESSAEGPVLKITGNARFYLGGFESQEYVETPFTSVQFNFYTRYLTAKTQDYGFTFKGTMTHDGKFDGTILSDGLGEVAKVKLAQFP